MKGHIYIIPEGGVRVQIDVVNRRPTYYMKIDGADLSKFESNWLYFHKSPLWADSIEKLKDIAESWACQRVKLIKTSMKEKLYYLTNLRATSLLEIQNKFTNDEWSFFVDHFRGKVVDGWLRLHVHFFDVCCQDVRSNNHAIAKWNINIPDLSAKIDTLTPAQVEAIYDYIEHFWTLSSQNDAIPE